MKCFVQSLILSGVLLIGCVNASSEKFIQYYFTGNCSAFTVPDQVDQLKVTLVGGAGASSQYTQTGYGSALTATISVNAGEVFYFCVGGGGGNNGAGQTSTGTGGWNGGGDGGYSSSTNQYGYGGGGASDIRTSINSLSSRIIVAAGGGGSGVEYSSALYYSSGGYGGCPDGTSGGTAANGVPDQAGGVGASTTSGGAGGYYPASNTGSAGTLGNGGDAGSGTSGGGGGGGYYGGGGGSNTAGGGGSSYFTNSRVLTVECGFPSYHSGDGYIQLSYNPYTVYNDRYDYTGTVVSFSVPDDVTDLFIQAFGAAGGNSSQGVGGYGGYIAVNLSIPSTGFETLSIAVGGVNGFSGGGSRGCDSAGLGGGTSLVYTQTYTLLMAGGGGGAGYDVSCTECEYNSINGGNGGIWNSINGSGSADPMSNVSLGGGGGYQYSGGSRGFYPPSSYGASGASGLGGSAAGGTCGGGGGAGYYGGGGGANTGGGGGSSGVLTTPVTDLTVVVDDYKYGVNRGNGYVIISYVSSTAVTDDTSTNSNDDHPTGANGPVIIGSIVVVLVFLCGLCVCLYFWRQRKSRMETALLESHSNQPEPSAPSVVNSPYVPPQSSYYNTNSKADPAVTSPLSKSSAASSAPPTPVYHTAEAHPVDPRLSDYAGSPIIAVRLEDNHPL